MAKKASLLPFIIVGLIAILGCRQLTEMANTSKGSNSHSDEPKSFKADGKEWSSFELDQTDIKVDLPGKPKDQSPQLPAGYKEVFSSAHIYSYDEKDFNSSVTEMIPTRKMNLPVKTLADTSMAALKRQIPDLTYTLDIKSDTNAKYNGTFTRNGKSYELRGCCVYKKTEPRRVWAVLALYAKDNADAQIAGQRIIDSVVFKDSSEVCK